MIRAAVPRRTSVLVAAAATAALLAGCGATEPDAAAPEPASSASPAGPPAPSTTPSPDATDTAPVDEGGPVDAFRTWLTASRAPDTATACAYMTPELAQRMVDEITAQGFPGVTDCTSLIAMTASLYAAVGQTAEPEVELVSETTTEAVLRVAYTPTSCGRVVLERGVEHWVLDERSEEAC